MKEQQRRILLAAGGTGGHVFPALAIADEIIKLKPQTVFLFVGTKQKIEARVVPQRGYAFATIWISGFHRRLRIGNLLFPLKVMISFIQSFFLIRRFKPDVVVGTGGYVCGPILYVASMLGIPIVVHESNSYPGITTRLLSGRATKIFTAFAKTNQWLRRQDNIELVGTPTRDVLGSVSKEDGLKFFHLDPAKKTVFAFGGSLGASSINNALRTVAPLLHAAGFQCIWQTGRTDAAVVNEMKTKNIGYVSEFIDAMEYAYAAADVIVSRAGATTLAEITRLGKPAILVPYPFAAADHQTFNAQTMVDAGAALMIPDSRVQNELQESIFTLLRDSSLQDSMSSASLRLGKRDAGSVIAQRILELKN